MTFDLKKKIDKVKLLILDVDGVLTGGEIALDEQGEERKFFNVQDGFGIVLFHRAGYKTAILSARSSKAVTARAEDLGIHKVCQDASPKVDAYRKIVDEFDLEDEEVCFMGDDLPDLEVLKKVGFAVTVPDAALEVKDHVDYVTTKSGGQGAVREVIELILTSHGKWAEIVKSYGA